MVLDFAEAVLKNRYSQLYTSTLYMFLTMVRAVTYKFSSSDPYTQKPS
jgi:hypothetical protein